MKKRIMVLISIFVISLLAGCTTNASVEEMMRPPKLSIGQEEVKNILKDILEPDAELRMPIGGENTSAIQFVNLDKDKEEEILVFYILENDSNPLRTLILDKKEEWKIIDGIKGIGSDFDSVRFNDITGDGTLEAIIGYRGEGFFEDKGVSIYDYRNGEVKEVFNNFYSALATGDLDEDGVDELILLKSDREEGKAKAELYKYKQNNINKIDETKMEAYTHYGHIVIGKATESKVGVFIDEGVGAHSCKTELLVMENGKLKNVFYDEEKGFVEKTFRAYFTESQDIDNDGIIEIALLRAPIASGDGSMAGTPWVNTWYNWDGDKDLIYKSESFFDHLAGFYFNFPEKWGINIAIDRPDPDSDKEEQWRRFSYVEEEGSEKYPLLTIETINDDKWEEKQKEYEDKKLNYFKLGSKADKIYIGILEDSVENTEAKEMMLGIEEIKANFNIIDK